MCFFNACNLMKGCCHLRKALLQRLIPKRLIHRVKFFIFVMLCHTQKLRNGFINIHGIAAVNVNRFPRKLLQMLIKNRRMRLLLLGSKPEYKFHHLHFLFFRLRRSEDITVSRLTFPCKGTHKVFLCFALFKIHSFPSPSFSLVCTKMKQLYPSFFTLKKVPIKGAPG